MTVPFGYLWTVGVLGLGTLLVLRPLRRPPSLATSSFLPGGLARRGWVCVSAICRYGYDGPDEDTVVPLDTAARFAHVLDADSASSQEHAA